MAHDMVQVHQSGLVYQVQRIGYGSEETQDDGPQHLAKGASLGQQENTGIKG